MSSLKKAFNAQLLLLGARVDSPSLVEATFGHANIATNSEALRIAAENKSYRAAAVMLNIASEAILPCPISFRLGKDWARVEELAKTDTKLAALMADYEKKSEEMLDGVFGRRDKTKPSPPLPVPQRPQ